MVSAKPGWVIITVSPWDSIEGVIDVFDNKDEAQHACAEYNKYNTNKEYVKFIVVDTTIQEHVDATV